MAYVILLANCFSYCYAPTNVMLHYPPPQAMLGNRWGCEFCKVQMHQLLDMPVSQIPIFSPLKIEEKMGNFLVIHNFNVITSN